MRLAVLVALLGGCITIVQPPASGDDESGSGAEDGDGVPDGCAFASSAGPHGHLVAFERAPDGTDWLLVGEGDTGVVTLWRGAAGAWSQRLFDEECRFGALAVDASSRAHVVCAVPSPLVADYDVRLFVSGAEQTTSRVVATATDAAGPTGGQPSSIVIDANGRAAVLWLSTVRGRVTLESTYRVSQDIGAAWSTRTVFSATSEGPNRYGLNDNGKLLVVDGELHFAVRVVSNMSVIVGRASSASVEEFSTRAPHFRASDWAFEYEVTKVDGQWHFVSADASDVYSDVGPGLVSHVRQTGDNPAIQTWVDGPAPVGPGAAGLRGVSMTLAPDGTPYVAYVTTETRSLRLARFTANTWLKSDITSGREVGDAVLRAEASGHLHVAYEDLDTGTIEILDEQCP